MGGRFHLARPTTTIPSSAIGSPLSRISCAASVSAARSAANLAQRSVAARSAQRAAVSGRWWRRRRRRRWRAVPWLHPGRRRGQGALREAPKQSTRATVRGGEVRTPGIWVCKGSGSLLRRELGLERIRLGHATEPAVGRLCARQHGQHHGHVEHQDVLEAGLSRGSPRWQRGDASRTRCAPQEAASQLVCAGLWANPTAPLATPAAAARPRPAPPHAAPHHAAVTQHYTAPHRTAAAPQPHRSRAARTRGATHVADHLPQRGVILAQVEVGSHSFSGHFVGDSHLGGAGTLWLARSAPRRPQTGTCTHARGGRVDATCT